MYMSWMDNMGFEVRKDSHMKSDVRPKVRMKLAQHFVQHGLLSWLSS